MTVSPLQLAEHGFFVVRGCSDDPLAALQTRPYTIRVATHHDTDALLQLEEACWEGSLRVGRSQLEARVQTGGTYVATITAEQRVAAVLYTQRLAASSDVRAVPLPPSSAAVCFRPPH